MQDVKRNRIRLWKRECNILCVLLNYEIQKQLREVFCKEDVPKNFAKFTGKQCRSLFFSSNVAGLGLQLYCKKEFDTGVFQ